ncbi:HAMP domain-containing protein, partial [bacterium]|nr:HAMP domain-containing protein [bacterium]
MLTSGTKGKSAGRHSLFRRIFVFMTLAAISIVVVVIGLFRLSAQRRVESKYGVAFKNLNVYAKIIVTELDRLEESELQNAIQLLLLERGILTRVRFADGKTMDVHEQGASQTLSEAETVESWLYSKDGVSFAIFKGAPVSKVSAETASKKREYFFTFKRSEAFDFDERILLIGVLLPLLVIWLLYRSVRQMLLPIRTLQNGVDSVAQGNLAVQLDDSGNDELSAL